MFSVNSIISKKQTRVDDNKKRYFCKQSKKNSYTWTKAGYKKFH